MSNLAIDSTVNQEKKSSQQRSCVSSKSLFNLKTIVTQNLTNNNNRKLAPLPLLKSETDSIVISSVQETEIKDLQMTIPKESHWDLALSEKVNKSEPSSNVPPLPLNRSIKSSDSTVLSSQRKCRLFPTQSKSRMNGNDSLNQTIELPIHRIDSASPTISTLTDENEEDLKLNGPLVFVNKSLSSLKISDSNERQPTRKPTNHHQSTNYTRLPYVLRSTTSTSSPPLMNTNYYQPQTRRSFPRFESVRTPIQKSPVIPAEVFDCCQTETKSKPRRSYNESERRSSYPRDTTQIRDIMIDVSQRLTKGLDPSMTLPIVDTHCHFDLIFDRLRIKHNDLTKYFTEYNEFYPSGLSFELAIQVFWRPQQLTESSWTDWFSKYLDNDRVYGSCGIHPHWSSAWTETSVDDIERCLQHPKIVAIGEIGLDFGPKNLCLIKDQRRAFEEQLKLAAKWSKPIVIHSRDAYEETFKLMKQYLKTDHKIHLHCFVGTYADVQMFTSYFTSIKFGFTPIITRANFLHTVIEQIQLTQILSETDSPYFTPYELSTYSRCAHPGMVYSVVEMVAQLRHLPIYDVACQLRENAREIYGI